MFCESRLSIILNVWKLILTPSYEWTHHWSHQGTLFVLSGMRQPFVNIVEVQAIDWLFICPAENQIQGYKFTLTECYGVVTRCAGVTGDGKWNQRRVNNLPDVMQIAIGMKITYGNLKYWNWYEHDKWCPRRDCQYHTPSQWITTRRRTYNDIWAPSIIYLSETQTDMCRMIRRSWWRCNSYWGLNS
jgi:hypothetical protein